MPEGCWAHLLNLFIQTAPMPAVSGTGGAQSSAALQVSCGGTAQGFAKLNKQRCFLSNLGTSPARF